MTEQQETKVYCPKCKGRELYLYELWKGHSIEWDQVDGKISRNDGVLEAGHPYKMEAKCRNKDCNHQWTVRNAIQIDNVLKH